MFLPRVQEIVPYVHTVRSPTINQQFSTISGVIQLVHYVVSKLEAAVETAWRNLNIYPESL